MDPAIKNSRMVSSKALLSTTLAFFIIAASSVSANRKQAMMKHDRDLVNVRLRGLRGLTDEDRSG